MKADVAGHLQPYLWPSGFTCAQSGSEQCRPRVLYNEAQFKEHRHPDSKAGKTAAVKVTGGKRQQDIYKAVAATKPTSRPNLVTGTGEGQLLLMNHYRSTRRRSCCAKRRRTRRMPSGVGWTLLCTISRAASTSSSTVAASTEARKSPLGRCSVPQPLHAFIVKEAVR